MHSRSLGLLLLASAFNLQNTMSIGKYDANMRMVGALGAMSAAVVIFAVLNGKSGRESKSTTPTSSPSSAPATPNPAPVPSPAPAPAPHAPAPPKSSSPSHSTPAPASASPSPSHSAGSTFMTLPNGAHQSGFSGNTWAVTTTTSTRRSGRRTILNAHLTFGRRGGGPAKSIKELVNDDQVVDTILCCIPKVHYQSCAIFDRDGSGNVVVDIEPYNGGDPVDVETCSLHYKTYLQGKPVIVGGVQDNATLEAVTQRLRNLADQNTKQFGIFFNTHSNCNEWHLAKLA